MWYEYVAIIVGVIVSMSFGYFVVAARARNLICDALGVVKVETKDGTVFTMLGPDSEPVKVPVGVKEGKEGEKEVIMGYAPLLYTMAWQITNDSAFKISQVISGVKSGLSRRMKGAAMEGVASGELPVEAALAFLPKKAVAAIAILKALGIGVGGNHPTGDMTIEPGRPKGGRGPI